MSIKIGDGMTKAEAIEQALWLASESKMLADAFRPAASEGEVIRVPMARRSPRRLRNDKTPETAHLPGDQRVAARGGRGHRGAGVRMDVAVSEPAEMWELYAFKGIGHLPYVKTVRYRWEVRWWFWRNSMTIAVLEAYNTRTGERLVR